MAVKQPNKITVTLWKYGVWLYSGAIAQTETGCIAYKLTGFVVVARFIHVTCFDVFCVLNFMSNK